MRSSSTIVSVRREMSRLDIGMRSVLRNNEKQMLSMTETSPLPHLSESDLTATWDEIASTQTMVGMFDAPEEPGRKLMASAFGTSLEQELFVQALDGDTIYDEGQAPSASFRRVRVSVEAAWSLWRPRTLTVASGSSSDASSRVGSYQVLRGVYDIKAVMTACDAAVRRVVVVGPSFDSDTRRR